MSAYLVPAARFRPFYSGMQFIHWQEDNCFNCKRYSHHSQQPLALAEICPVELALHQAADGDGTVSKMVAEHLGYLLTDGSELEFGNWPCGDLEPTTPEIADAARRWHERHDKREVAA